MLRIAAKRLCWFIAPLHDIYILYSTFLPMLLLRCGAKKCNSIDLHLKSWFTTHTHTHQSRHKLNTAAPFNVHWAICSSGPHASENPSTGRRPSTTPTPPQQPTWDPVRDATFCWRYASCSWWVYYIFIFRLFSSFIEPHPWQDYPVII